MPSTTRPLTIREIQAKRKQEREAEQNKTRITNTTRLQTITIQLYGKKDKKATSQLSIQVGPKKSVELPTARLNEGQIDNLRKQGLIVTSKVGPNGAVEEASNYKAFLGKKKKNKVSQKKIEEEKKAEAKPARKSATAKKKPESKTNVKTDTESES